jgi:hypothetical protein
LREAIADLAYEHFKLEALLSLFEKGVGAVDSSGLIVFVSPSAESLLDQDERGLIGKSCATFSKGKTSRILTRGFQAVPAD